MLSKPVYLDYNATSPVHPELKAHILEWVEAWGNPSSIHAHGRESKKLLRDARQAFAKLIGCHPLEIIFTSGGSEANNTVINGLLDSELAKTRREIISTHVEHPSVLKALNHAQTKGFTVHYIPVNKAGELDVDAYKNLLSEKTLLVSVMSANNETGMIFPIPKIAKLAKQAGALVHTDGVQTLGRIGFNVEQMGVDFASFSGHKFYSLKGCGVLYSRRGQPLTNLIFGGGQERGRRAGTENTVAIAAIGFMAQKLLNEDHHERMKTLRDLFEAKATAEIPGVTVNCQGAKRLPNTSSLILDGVNGESMLMSLDVRGFSVSTGAACSSGNPEPSPTLLNIGLTHDEAQSSLRVSFGWMTTQEQVEAFVEALKAVVKHLRSLNEEQRSGA
jgi:cysteine desulfurase